jgi:hypothetical protein
MEKRIELLDVVVLREPFGELPEGAIGTVVEHLEEDVFEIEFSGKDGVSYAFEALSSAKLLKVINEPVLA